jgi:hypothetical protein
MQDFAPIIGGIRMGRFYFDLRLGERVIADQEGVGFAGRGYASAGSDGRCPSNPDTGNKIR